MKPKPKRQPPFKGGRVPAASAFHPKLEKAIRREMTTFNVSRSFVIATCCDFALETKLNEGYK